MTLRRFRSVLPVLLIASLPVLIVPGVTALATEEPWHDGSSVLVVPSLVRIDGKPVQVGTLPFGEKAPYLFVLQGGRMGVPVPTPPLHEILAAQLSPTSKWVAYTSQDATVIADLSGKVLEQYGSAAFCRWSPDGRAVAMALHEAEGPRIAIYRPGERRTQFIRELADEVDWRSDDSLLFRRGRDVVSLDPRTGRNAITKHHGVRVSPDGLYSFGRNSDYWSGTRIVHDRSESDLTAPVFAALGPGKLHDFAEPFWVKGTPHLLCIAACGTWTLPDGMTEWACRTGTIDVMTLELVAAWPGMSLGSSADGRAVWITDGFDVRPHPLAERNRPVRNPSRGSGADEIRVHMVFRGWTHRSGFQDVKLRVRKEPLPEEKTYTLRIGDVVPSHNSWEPALALVDIVGSRRAVFHLVSQGYTVTLPGDHARELDYFEVGRAPVTVSAPPDEAPCTVQLSVIP